MCTGHMEVELHFFVLNASLSLDDNGWKWVTSNHKFDCGHIFAIIRRLLLSPSLDHPTVCTLRCIMFKEEQGLPLVFRARTFTATITQVVFIQGIDPTHRRRLLQLLNVRLGHLFKKHFLSYLLKNNVVCGCCRTI